MGESTERICGLASCGQPFIGRGKRLYCSDKCAKLRIKEQLESLKKRRARAAAEKREREWVCMICQTKFTPTNKFAPVSSLRYCSAVCKKEGQERILDAYRKNKRQPPNTELPTTPQ